MPDVTITVRSRGPYLVRGPIDLRDAEGNVLEQGDRDDVALCRCGGSATKPFCDGTHAKIGFMAPEEPPR